MEKSFKDLLYDIVEYGKCFEKPFIQGLCIGTISGLIKRL